MLRTLAVLSVTALLAACTPHPSAGTAADASGPATAATNVLAGTPMAAYGTALNRAKSVQGIVNAQAKKQAAEIESASSSH